MSKRNRIARSSSLGEVGLLTTFQPIEPPMARFEKKRPAPIAAAPKLAQRPVENSKPSVAKPEQPRRSILTIGSPLRERNSESSEKPDERYGVFLEACYCCKKKIAAKDDVFMYGYLRAFCSLDCRNIQICIDDRDRKPSPKSTQIIAENFLKKGPERQGFTKHAGA